MFQGTIKDIVTNVIALLTVIIVAIQQGLAVYEGQDINWITVAFGVAIAVGNYFIGKDSKGKAKVQ